MEAEKDEVLFIKFRVKSSSVERDFSCCLKIDRDPAVRMGGWEDHSTGQERWKRMFWRVILCLSVMVPRGVAH